MLWNTSLLPAGSPFVALRKDFERQLGLDQSPAFAAMTVTEYSNRWVVSVDLPGVEEKDIDITFNDGSLVIEGDRKATAVEGAKELFSDRASNKFRRVLKVREAVNPGEIEASLSDGVLTVTLMRVPETAPQKIIIRSGTAATENQPDAHA